MNYTFSIMDLPVSVDRIEFSFAPNMPIMCANCGMTFPEPRAVSVVTHALKVKKSGLKYGQRGSKAFEKKICPACGSHHLVLKNSYLQ